MQVSKKRSVREWVREIHLWLGIGSGLILFVVCLTGTILAFEHEILHFLEEQHVISKERLDWEPLLSRLEQAEGLSISDVVIYGDDEPLLVMFHPDPQSKRRRGPSFLIDPSNGQKLGKPNDGKGHAFFLSMMKLHRWLLLERSVGRVIVGVATIIFSILCLTGLWLWFPKNWRKWQGWKRGLAVKTGSGWKRFNYDLHNSLGFYSLPLLLVMSLTGLLWSFSWYWQGVEGLLGHKLGKGRFDRPIEVEMNTTHQLPLQTLINKADHALAMEESATRITFAKPGENASILIRQKPKGFFAPDAPDKVQIHPQTGEILSLERFSEEPLMAKIAILIRGLHVGSAFGMGSKILYFLACLIATSLPVTGTLIWVNRLKKTRKAKRRAVLEIKPNPA